MKKKGVFISFSMWENCKTKITCSCAVKCAALRRRRSERFEAAEERSPPEKNVQKKRKKKNERKKTKEKTLLWKREEKKTQGKKHLAFGKLLGKKTGKTPPTRNKNGKKKKKEKENANPRNKKKRRKKIEMLFCIHASWRCGCRINTFWRFRTLDYPLVRLLKG